MGPLVSLNTDSVPQGLGPRWAEPNAKDRLGAGSSGDVGKGPLGQRLSCPAVSCPALSSLAERADWAIAWEYKIIHRASRVALVVKDPPAEGGDARSMGSIPG